MAVVFGIVVVPVFGIIVVPVFVPVFVLVEPVLVLVLLVVLVALVVLVVLVALIALLKVGDNEELIDLDGAVCVFVCVWGGRCINM